MVGPEFAPVWAFSNAQETESFVVPDANKMHLQMQKLFMGLGENGCQAPCTTNLAKSLKMSESDITAKNGIMLDSNVVAISLGKRYTKTYNYEENMKQ